MPRFRAGAATSPLLPAHGASSLGLSKKKSSPSSVWASVGEAGLALAIAGTIFAAIIYCLMSLESRRSAALSSRPSRELPGTNLPTRNAALQQRLDALIEEATKVAQEQGILTEVDAAENARLRRLNKEEDYSWILDDSDDENDSSSKAQRVREEVGQRAKAGQCSIKNSSMNECGPHGVCLDNQCSCAVAFTGTYCGHSVLLSHPYTPEGVNIAQVGYEGDFLLLQTSKLQEENELEAVRHVLPLSDDLFKGNKIFESCAVVGDGGSLLLDANYGAAIDSHSLVFRTERLHGSKKDYTKYLGTKPGVRVVENLSEQKKDILEQTTTMAGESLVAFPNSQNLEYLKSSSASSEGKTYRILHPSFLKHVRTAFGSSFSSNSFEEKTPLEVSVMLALNTCRVVRVYGIAPLPGLPETYYDIKCPSKIAAEKLLQKQNQQRSWVALEKYYDAGLIEFGEQCLVECMGGSDIKEKCILCRKEHDLGVESVIAAMKACP